ncbi:NADH-quinone oxidoreductase subunit C, partial [Streptomyces sp. NPDC050738]
ADSREQGALGRTQPVVAGTGELAAYVGAPETPNAPAPAEPNPTPDDDKPHPDTPAGGDTA